MLYREQTFAPRAFHSELQQTNPVNTQKSPPWAYDKGCAEACAERFSALNIQSVLIRGHLRVPKILTFKKRQSAKLFFWKWVLICTRSNLDPELFCACRGERSRAHSQTRKHWGRECTRRKSHFCVYAFALSLALKQRLGSTLKWPITCRKRCSQ